LTVECPNDAATAKDQVKNSSDVSVKEAVLDILSKDPACYLTELQERLKHNYGLDYSKDYVEFVLNGFGDGVQWTKVYRIKGGVKVVDMKFASLQGKFEAQTVRDRVMEKKASRDEVSHQKDAIGRRMEHAIAKILSDVGCSEVEIRKESYNGTTLDDNYTSDCDRYDIDVFARHPLGHYLDVQSRNMKSEIETGYICDIRKKNARVRDLWNITIQPSLVCSFIASDALRKASEINIPVVATGAVFVPDETWSVFKSHMELTQVRLYRRMDEESFNKLTRDIREKVLNMNPAQR